MGPKTVRCKFLCRETGQSFSGSVLHRAKFWPVYGDKSPENKEFFAYTSNAELTLDGVKEQHFEAGKEYYIDITEALAPVEATAEAPAESA